MNKSTAQDDLLLSARLDWELRNGRDIEPIAIIWHNIKYIKEKNGGKGQ